MSQRHDVSPVPRLGESSGRTRVVAWFASCETCDTRGPERLHRALAAHDADRHRPHGDPFSEGNSW